MSAAHRPETADNIRHLPVAPTPQPATPPQAIVLMYTPDSGTLTVQWPEDKMDATMVEKILATSLEATRQLVRARNGGLILPSN